VRWAASDSISVYGDLATIAILLAANSKLFAQAGDSTSDQIIESQFLSSPERRTHVSMPKLVLNLQDHAFFTRRILLDFRVGERAALEYPLTFRVSSHIELRTGRFI
jgi:hypothetical protein